MQHYKLKMNLILTRQKKIADGIFSILTGYGDTAFTLEHAYQNEAGDFYAKLPSGTYICVRGQHQLHSMDQPFTTFEVTTVLGHNGILFHVGNYNRDSDGCILLGSSVFHDVDNGRDMIINSRDTFEKFMAKLEAIDTFTLEVI